MQISGRLCDSWLTFYQATPHDSVSVTEGHGTQGELGFSVSWASPVPGVPHPQIPLWLELSPSLWPTDPPPVCLLDREGPTDREGESIYNRACGEMWRKTESTERVVGAPI